MALQLSLSNHPSLRSNSASNSALSIASSSSSSVFSSSSSPPSPSPKPLKSVKIAGRAPRAGLGAVRCGVETAVPAIGQVTEVDKDSFWPIVGSAGARTVVLDMYTQWCGPCKLIAPKLQELSEKYSDVIFLKLDCNQENKPLAKELGIRVVPTFKILKDNKIMKEVTGAKFDDLVAAIETVRSS